MTLAEFLALLKECPLVASVQASPGSPLDDPETLLKLAKASLSQGVKVLRLEGVENIKRIKGETGAQVIGLIKRKYPDSELYITPTMREVEELLETDCEVIAIDARTAPWYGKGPIREARPNGERLAELVQRCHAAGHLVLGDCRAATVDLGPAQDAGCDLCSTTFNTLRRGACDATEPCRHDLRRMISEAAVPLLAEGGYTNESQVRSAMRMGAAGVVVGGALNDPVKQTQRFLKATKIPTTNVGAVDIGGSWLRFGLFSPDWKLLTRRTVPVPKSSTDRFGWIVRQAQRHGVTLVGVSTGGVYSPWSNTMLETKETIQDNAAVEFICPGLAFHALNDGLATAWGHSCWIDRLKEARYWDGDDSVTLTVGSGLGCGIVGRANLSSGCEPPRLNDLQFDEGKTFEEALGGLSLTSQPTIERQDEAYRALLRAVDIVSAIVRPSTLFLAGGVVFSPWMRKRLGNPKKGSLIRHLSPRTKAWPILSPFGTDAGLYGAAALALFPPIGVFPE